MRSGLASIAAALVLLVETSSADPFTGRYNIESIVDRGVSVSGFIDFFGAPTGTKTFRLGDSFVAGFSIVVAGPGISTLVYDPPVYSDFALTFDAALGSAQLLPFPYADVNVGWAADGDLDHQGDSPDFIVLAYSSPPFLTSTYWVAYEDYYLTPLLYYSAGSYIDSSPAWKLVLATTAPVPEPSTVGLCGLAASGAIAWRRRRHKV